MGIPRDNELRTAYRNAVSVSSTFKPVRITEYVPFITSKDTERGYVNRYFVCPVSESTPAAIIEVDQSTFTKLQSNNFYKFTTLKWIIRGAIDTVTALTETQQPIILRYGVVDANKKAVEIANGELPGMADIVTNFVRFYQGL